MLVPSRHIIARVEISKTNEVFSLHDAADGVAESFVASVETLKNIASDRSRPLEERLEAYEDIIDSELGDTSLIRARNVERDVGVRQLYLKLEGGNPTGTQKDRIAFAQAMDALRRGFECITVASCGNYGAAISLASSLAGLRCLIFIPKTYHTRRLDEMTLNGAEIVRFPGDYEGAVEASREQSEKEELYDANPGGANSTLQLRVYGEIAYETYDELRDAPAVVAVPVSNGTTLAGVNKGFLSLYRRGKTSRIPRIVAGSSHRKNPIVDSYLRNAPTCEDLTPERIRETSINEPLINWHSSDGDHALSAVRSSRGWASNASDRRMLALSKLIREKEGFQVLPASCAALEALLEGHQREPLGPDRYVVVLTGRKT